MRCCYLPADSITGVTMRPRVTPMIAALTAAATLLTPQTAAAQAYTPGAAGVGDPYFPQAGNGGYDARHYDLNLAYDPSSRKLTARTTMLATATRDLSRFNLDFSGPKVRAVSVNGRPAKFRRAGSELVVTPAARISHGDDFRVVVSYAGRPRPIKDAKLGVYGWVPTSDGAVVLSQPDGARSFYPVNDHPRDKATYRVRITVPKGLTALASGEPVGEPKTRGGRTTFEWASRQPMASYL